MSVSNKHFILLDFIEINGEGGIARILHRSSSNSSDKNKEFIMVCKNRYYKRQVLESCEIQDENCWQIVYSDLICSNAPWEYHSND